MVVKNIDDKEALELKKVYNHLLNERTDVMKNTQFKVEDVFGVIISKESISSEQNVKLNYFLATEL